MALVFNTLVTQDFMGLIIWIAGDSSLLVYSKCVSKIWRVKAVQRLYGLHNQWEESELWWAMIAAKTLTYSIRFDLAWKYGHKQEVMD